MKTEVPGLHGSLDLVRTALGLRYWRTTPFRLAVLFSCLFALGVGIFIGLIYWQTAGYMSRLVDQAIVAQLSALRGEGGSTLTASVDQAVAVDYRRIYLYGLFDAQGRVLAGNLAAIPSGLPIDGGVRSLRLPSGIMQFRQLPMVRAAAASLPSGGHLVVARDSAQLDDIRHILRRALLWVGSLVVLAGMSISIILGLRPLRRLGELQQASRTIMGGDMHARLPIAGTHDELDMLAAIVNRMLDEIERLMTEVKGACDSIAHDLRTPLTRLRARLYRMQQGTSAERGDPQVLASAIADVDGLLARFRALLRISEISDGRRRAGFADVELGGLLTQIVELYEPLAEEKGLRLRVNPRAPAHAACDRELLFEALSNLVDNAIKFSPRNAEICLDLLQGEKGARIEISDAGPGIPERERRAVMQRFYRSRQVPQVSGHGLGLSIVAAVVELHDFGFEFAAAGTNGTRAVLRCWPQVLDPEVTR